MKRLGHFFINRWKTWLDISFIVLYAVLTLLLVLHHEPWRDEAHPWLIVQRYGFIELFFKYLHLVYGGCPFLWYLLLFPFVKLGFPYTSMLFLNWSIAVGAAALFVINAPFKRIFKYCLIFSRSVAGALFKNFNQPFFVSLLKGFEPSAAFLA